MFPLCVTVRKLVLFSHLICFLQVPARIKKPLSPAISHPGISSRIYSYPETSPPTSGQFTTHKPEKTTCREGPTRTNEMTKKLDWVSVWVQVEHASIWKSRVLCDRWHGKKVFLLGFVTGNTWMVSTGKNLRPVMCKCLHTWIEVIVHKTCFQFFCVSSLSAFFKLCEFYRHSPYILLVLEWMKQRFLPLNFNSFSSTKV